MKQACLVLGVAAAAGSVVGINGTGECIAPGVCTAPQRKYSYQTPIKPRQQWNIAGGFCGDTSVQVMMLSHGAWVSADLIRKANIGAPCFGHSSPGLGCEVGPENYNATATGLGLKFEVWDYNQPQPQAKAFKSWMKKHLAVRTPVMWAPMCAGDSHTPYGPQSCPNGGHFDHHEAIIGLGSNHPLDDPTVHDDDWMLHHSMQDLQTYFRTFDSLEDTAAMDGNCKNADPTFRRNEMYPCFYDQVTYGLAISGFTKPGPSQRITMDVNNQREPNVRSGEPAVALTATLTVHDLTPGREYTLYRYAGAYPTTNWEDGFTQKTTFTPQADTWTFEDPNTFMSDTAALYAVPQL